MLLAALFLLLLGAGLCCPPACDCKWKSGKDSAICVRGNLTAIPPGLDHSLQLLDLTSNPISAIGQDAFSNAGLLNLQKIYLSKCRIRNLNRYAFRKLSNLVELDLSYNAMSTVPSHIFDSISELRELKLSGNPIQRVANDAFINVQQLVKLELSECRVSTLEPRAFSGLENSLEWLKLDNNRLVEVRPSTITGLINLHGLELGGNPWNCSCNIRPIKLWMASNKIPLGVPATCSHPLRLRGKTWDKLPDSEFACTPGISPVTPVVQATEGTNVSMSCTVTGNPNPTVRWFWKNRPIANVSGLPSHRKIYIFNYNATRSTLTIYSTELSDAGIYFCVASNRAGKVQSNVTLTILRKKLETKFTGKVLGLAAGLACLFLIFAFALFCFLGQPKKQPRMSQAENYEKIELDKKGDPCFSDIQPSNKIHPTLCEYRQVPSVEDGEEETSHTVLHKPHPTISREVEEDLTGVQQHILRKEILPTTSLYTTATPEDRNFPDLLTTPPPHQSLSATLPRSKCWSPRVSSSQSPLLASSRCGSSTGESSVSNSRRYSVESRASAYYSRTGGRRCERSASSLDLYDQDQAAAGGLPWHHPSLPTSPLRHKPTQRSPVTETPILNLLGSAVYDYHAAQLERFIDEYRNLQEELTRMKETCEGLRDNRRENSELYSLYNDIYRN